MTFIKDTPLEQLPQTDILLMPPHTSNPQNFRNDQAPEQILKGWKWFLVCTGIYITAFLFGLGNTVTANSQGPIISSLGGIDKIGWVGVGFLLGSVATMLPLGEAHGIFNIKWVYINSIVIFEIGSLVCGSAQTMAALIIERVVGGVEGIGIYLG
jgi:MFS family permease